MSYLLNDIDVACVRVLLVEHISNCKSCPLFSYPIDVAVKCRRVPCGAGQCITAIHRRLLYNIETSNNLDISEKYVLRTNNNKEQ